MALETGSETDPPGIEPPGIAGLQTIVAEIMQQQRAESDRKDLERREEDQQKLRR